MKIPSLFKTPKYQRFDIRPRYYDPIKEEIEQRTSQIKRELELRPDAEKHSSHSTIAGSFTRKRSKPKSVNMMQAVILLLLVGGIVGYWFFGNLAVYAFLILSSILLYLKVKRVI